MATVHASSNAKATASSVVTVNAAFLQEIKEVNQELWSLLEELQCHCLPAACLSTPLGDLAVMLSELRDQIALHFALEEAYGYFDEPVFVEPRLCRHAASLRQEHQSLYLMISELVDVAEDYQFRGAMPHQITVLCNQFLAFYDQLQAHEARENDLIMQAYEDDIGVGD